MKARLCEYNCACRGEAAGVPSTHWRRRKKPVGSLIGKVMVSRRCSGRALKRGYAIFVHHGKEYLRVRKFDPDKNVYVIGSTPADEVPIAETKATAVGRSAGG